MCVGVTGAERRCLCPFLRFVEAALYAYPVASAVLFEQFSVPSVAATADEAFRDVKELLR